MTAYHYAPAPSHLGNATVFAAPSHPSLDPVAEPEGDPDPTTSLFAAHDPSATGPTFVSSDDLPDGNQKLLFHCPEPDDFVEMLTRSAASARHGRPPGRPSDRRRRPGLPPLMRGRPCPRGLRRGRNPTRRSVWPWAHDGDCEAD